MSTYIYDNFISEFNVYFNFGELNGYHVDYESGVRPSISIKPEVKIAEGGDRTSTSPYEFVVE